MHRVDTHTFYHVREHTVQQRRPFYAINVRFWIIAAIPYCLFRKPGNFIIISHVYNRCIWIDVDGFFISQVISLTSNHTNSATKETIPLLEVHKFAFSLKITNTTYHFTFHANRGSVVDLKQVAISFEAFQITMQRSKKDIRIWFFITKPQTTQYNVLSLCPHFVTELISLVPKETMVSDSVGTRPWYLAALRKDQAISQPVLKHGFRRAVFVKRSFGDA